jgi:hypothetical protein
MNTKEIQEQLKDTQEITLRLEERVTNLEKRESKTPGINILDHSIELDTIINELRNHNKEDKVDQLLGIATSIKETMDRQPAPVNRQFRILLFPETNTMQYYKLVFGRLVPCIFALIVLLSAISFGRQVLAARQVQTYNSEAEKIVKAWIYMDEHADKKLKKQMNQAMKNASN